MMASVESHVLGIVDLFKTPPAAATMLFIGVIFSTLSFRVSRSICGLFFMSGDDIILLLLASCASCFCLLGDFGTSFGGGGPRNSFEVDDADF